MASNTEKLGLIKPAQNDYYDIGVFNYNMQLIDDAIGDVAAVLNEVLYGVPFGDIVNSWQAGENVIGYLLEQDEDYKLEFRGQGAITSGPEAFTAYAENITQIKIGKGITVIPSNYFEGLSGVTDVVIPDSMASIGGRAFKGCTALSKIYIPASVERMWMYVFDDCSGLEIYCGIENKPHLWASRWNYYDSTHALVVHWNVTPEEYAGLGE
jgi:hypothetical protein